MPDWLTSGFQSDAELSLAVLIERQVVAFLLGCVIAYVYWLTQGGSRAPRRGQGGPQQPITMMATLVLLTVLIGMIGSVVGNNVARAFSLVGALSIVRFRTVVEDTRDTAFVIFAVAVGMAVGAGYLKVPLVGMPFVAMGALLFRGRSGAQAPSASTPPGWLVTVRLGASFNDETALAGVLGKQGAGCELLGIATARQGAAVDRTYRLRLPADNAHALVDELNRVVGMQQVELRLDE